MKIILGTLEFVDFDFIILSEFPDIFHGLTKEKYIKRKRTLYGYSRMILNKEVDILIINPQTHPEYYIWLK